MLNRSNCKCTRTSNTMHGLYVCSHYITINVKVCADTEKYSQLQDSFTDSIESVAFYSRITPLWKILFSTAVDTFTVKGKLKAIHLLRGRRTRMRF